jgi:hypothetical protein
MAGAVHAQREESATVVPVPQVAAIPIEEKPAPAETAPSPFLVAEAVPVSAPVPVGEPAAGPPTPDPAPAPGGDQPAPTPPVIQETAPPPKPSGVTEEPKKPNDTK